MFTPLTQDELDAIRLRLDTMSDDQAVEYVNLHTIAMSERTPCPQPGPQTDFLNAAADIVVYGGAAGGGKSFGLLLDPLKYIGNPEFGFVIFRRTSPQIENEGGLWDTSMKIYPLTNGVPIRGDKIWRFPSGAKCQFRHMQHEDTKLDWQGSQIPWIGFDELTHFSEGQFFYMLSRNRSACGVKPCIRATTNPDGGSWVKRFLSPWIDKEYINPAKSGEIRWFTRVNGEIFWVDEEWRDDDGQPAKSVTFIRSSVYDNKILLDKDPGYLVNLKSLPTVEQERLLHGNWDILEGSYFSEFSEHAHCRLWYQVPRWYHWFGGLDYGKSAPFCFLLCASDENGNVIVVDEIYEPGLESPQQAHRVNTLLKEYGLTPRNVAIYADPSIFPPRSNTPRAGNMGQLTIRPASGKFISEDYTDLGLNMIPADNDRLNGWARVREFIHEPGKLTVLRKCRHLIRTLPVLPHDKFNPEDLDTHSEDHAADALRYALMSRPRKSAQQVKKTDHRPYWMKQNESAGTA